ncbi:RNA polymerase sigma factor [Qipengyuania marisflavi]|uniref:RNA polymerase sigma factor n=1 Tax=Qipengyuania marisflavi TaxID=2486356 RepID=UPI001486F77B|nr:sigma-70 family RNA polymerase sigma factor [Qipengyuania marisflavi]
MQNPQSPQDQVSQTVQGLSENEMLSLDIGLVGDLDREAFQRLYARTSSKLFAICLAVTRDHAAAEDVLQESYLKIWDRAKGYDPERNRPLAWMCAIARNAAIDWYRARARHHHVSDDHLNLQESEAAAADDRIIAMNREDQVWTAVSDLDAESEQELKSIFLLGLTYPEAAQRLGLPVATFKSRVRRTVIRIRRKLADD